MIKATKSLEGLWRGEGVRKAGGPETREEGPRIPCEQEIGLGGEKVMKIKLGEGDWAGGRGKEVPEGRHEFLRLKVRVSEKRHQGG